MTKADRYMKTGDTSPPLEVTLTDDQGDPVESLDGASVRFKMNDVDDVETIVDRAAEIVDAEKAIVAFQWLEADTQEVGVHRGEFKVDRSGALGDDFDADETYPSNDYIDIKISESL